MALRTGDSTGLSMAIKTGSSAGSVHQSKLVRQRKLVAVLGPVRRVKRPHRWLAGARTLLGPKFVTVLDSVGQ
jgi:hypothetical protein